MRRAGGLHLQRQEEAFGSERVFTFRARPHVSSGPHRRAAIVFAAIAAAAGSWIVLASALGVCDYEPWLIFGILFVLLFAFSALALWFSDARPRIRNWQRSSLVVGPAGLALVQGDMPRRAAAGRKCAACGLKSSPRLSRELEMHDIRQPAHTGCSRRHHRHCRHLLFDRSP